MPIVGLADCAQDGPGKDKSPYGPGGIYHEKQVGSLCAIHAVNNMLQGPLYEDWNFRQVAMELDRQERSLMGGGDLDYGNARYDGFYNVQVVQEVLRKAGYDMTPISAEAARDVKKRAKERAFILNKQEHWFSVRRIGEEWFDLNSCMATPKHYKDSDLEWLITDADREGYSVFLVRGDFPRSPLEDDLKKLVEAKEGCGGPRTGYSLYAGSGQSLSSGAGPKVSDAAAMRAARLARLGGGAPPPSPPAESPAEPSVAAAPAAAPVAVPAAATPAPAAQSGGGGALEQLESMGFGRDAAKHALEAAGGDLNKAAEILLSG
mmetsp:Transcript_55362/g.103885  ORF Transcript_55362/g.103885 Transcript_55362/m.103885 type:complete len:320 (+) Transcript_55362:50-1009(+)